MIKLRTDMFKDILLVIATSSVFVCAQMPPAQTPLRSLPGEIEVAMLVVPRPTLPDLSMAGAIRQMTQAEEYLAIGDTLFQRRAVAAQDGKAEPRIIRSAIRSYQAALNAAVHDRAMERVAGERILRAYYFLGSFASTPSERLAIFEKSRLLGDILIARHPDHVGITYWWAVNMSIWAKESGPLQAVRAGVADRIRNSSERLLTRKPNDPGIGRIYQVLGRMHHVLPRIPLLLSWPDNSLAESYLRKALQRDPSDQGTRLFLAELLRDQGRIAEMKQVARDALRRGVRPEMTLEDNRSLWKLREMVSALKNG